MEWNAMDLVGKGMEWSLKILFGCYKIKEWNEMQVTSFGSDIGGNQMELIYNNITIIPLILNSIKDNQWELIIALKCLAFSGWCETS